MGKKKYIIISAIILIISGIYSCVENYFELDKLSTEGIEWNPNLAIPLVNSNIGINKLLENLDSTDYLYEDSTNLLSLIYETDLFSQSAEEFIDIQDQNYIEAYTRSDYDLAGGFVNDSVVMIKDNVPFPFSVLVTQLLDSMVFQSALMEIQVNSTFQHTGKLEISFPGMVKDGIPYKRIIDINTPSGNFNYQEQFDDFEDYFVDLTNFGIESNTFFVNYKLTLYDTGSGTVQNSSRTDINIDFTDIEYKFVFGYLGSFDQSLADDSLDVSVLGEITEGSIHFANPKFTLKVDNSFGIPLRFGFTDFKAYFEETDSYTPISGDSVPLLGDPENEFIIYKPEYIQGQGIMPVLSTKTITGFGSNITDVIADAPDAIIFAMGYLLNPPEYSSDSVNFIADNSMLDISFSIDIPLFFYGEFTGFRDTMEVNLADVLDTFEAVDLALMRLNVTNGLPIDIGIQVYFHDDIQNQPLDSLFEITTDQFVIEGGQVNAQYRVDQETGKTNKISDILMDSDKIERIRDTEFFDVKFLIRTTDIENETPVKFYSDYTIDLEMGIQLNGKIKVD